MNVKTFYCIGVMSGTSLDGVDICYVKFDVSDQYNFEILEAETVSYSKDWLNKLKNAFTTDKSALKQVDIEYGGYLGNLIADFMEENKIDQLDFIASHGHTIFHKPEEGYTLQIGDGQKIASITNQKVICDFRTQDVNLGGQGAPLVPIGDQLLFSEYDYCINFGGFANISFKKNGERIAFDVCPVNIVMNHYMNQLGLSYDNEGELASAGEIHDALFRKLNELEFYNQSCPKSLGLEWVLENIFPLIDDYQLEIRDILRTFVEHVAFQISKIIKSESKILVTGGGVFNTFLMQRIAFYSHQEIVLPYNELIEFKEALIFAFLGLLRLQEKDNVLSSVTGASKNHSAGVIFDSRT